MTGEGSNGEGARRRAAEQGDAEAMFELGTSAEEQARQLMADARAWFERSARAGSLDAVHALVRLAVASRDYSHAQWLLQEAEREHAGVPAEWLVSVAPDVLGSRLALDGDGEADDGDAVFTVISPRVAHATAAVARVAERLMDVDEHGVEQSWEERQSAWEPGADWPYTPNCLFDVTWNSYAAQVHLDTKGWNSAAMGRTMVGILVDALVADAVPAHIAGRRHDLDGDFIRVWEDPSAGE